MDKKEINEMDLEKVSGGNDMVIKEEHFNQVGNEKIRQGGKEYFSIISGVIVTYKCPNCSHEYIEKYIGYYMTQKGYPATMCPKCHKCYWGGEELKRC